MKCRLSLLVLLVLLVAPAVGRAGPTFSLSAPGADLSNLQVGDVVLIQVDLGGLNAGDGLEYLAAVVQFDPAVLAPTGINPGSVVPDVTGFAGSTFNDSADGNYDSLFAGTGAAITSNGDFYTFGVRALAAGGGAFRFGVVDSIGAGANGDALPGVTAGGSLSFEVRGGAVVPAPAGVALLASAAGCLAALQALRRRGAGVA